jgi:uncharacterized membrane-anchored protein YitT (DUF2179 family)
MKHSNTNNWFSQITWETIILLLLGPLFIVFGLKGFMIPNKFLDGGVLGSSILLHEIYHFNIGILIILLNIPFLIIGYHKIGKQFAFLTLLSAIITALFFTFVEVPVVTHDKILTSIFGGVCIGVGMGLVIKAGGVIDGLEVIADYTTKQIGLSTGEIVLSINALVIAIAAYNFGIETGMYSILTYFTAMKVSDYVVDGFEEYTALHIVSPNHEDDIKSMIVNDFNKAISVNKSRRGYLPHNMETISDCDTIVVILTRLELHKIKLAVIDLDPAAFLYVHSIKEVKGGVIKQKRKRH